MTITQSISEITPLGNFLSPNRPVEVDNLVENELPQLTTELISLIPQINQSNTETNTSASTATTKASEASASAASALLSKNTVQDYLATLAAGSINDTTSTNTTTYSSNKINQMNNLKANTESLGTAAYANLTTSNTDTTAGRVLKVGDIGSNKKVIAVVDCNTLPEAYPYTGFVPIVTDTGSTNAPDSTIYYYIQQTQYIAGGCTQIAYPYHNSNKGIYQRTRYQGVWTSWKLQYGQDNILGTVSQAAGVPTGAIIESGSNANGTYTKFADGTLICKSTNSHGSGASIHRGTADYYVSIGYTSPAAFVGSLNIHASGADVNTFWIGSAYPGVIFLTSPFSTYTTLESYVTAIGRWF